MNVLKSKIIPVRHLSAILQERMFKLFSAAYDHVSHEVFAEDLSWKDEVILLLDDSGELQGFTTLAFNPKGLWISSGDVLFSGDTIIDPAYWGSNELVRAFCERAGEWRASSGRRLFWMLISKGHRTFLFLPLFAKRFFPHPKNQEIVLSEVVDTASRHLFGNAWFKDRGVIHFTESLGQLKPELVEATWQRREKTMVRYFIEKNPGFAAGDELVCLTEMDTDNLKRVALNGFELGLNRVCINA
ncbi:MAG: hypothetical protein QM496_16075 [Verrucomicrobiota bacterium]